MHLKSDGCGQYSTHQDLLTYGGYDLATPLGTMSTAMSADPLGIGNAVLFNYNNGNTSYNLLRFPFVVAQDGKTLVIFGKFKIPVTTSSIKIITLNNSSVAEQCNLFVNAAGYLEIRNNTTVLGTGTIKVNTGALLHISAKILVGNTGSCNVQVEGVTDINVSSVDTQQQSTNSVSYVYWCASPFTSPNVLLTHFGIFNTDAGDTCNDHPNPKTVKKVLLPGSNVQQQFTNSGGGSATYTSVDEILGSVSTADYNYASTTNKDKFGLASTISASAVFGVEAVCHAQKNDAGAISAKIGVESGGNAQSTSITLGTGFATFRSSFYPYTTGTTQWTGATVNGLYLTEEVV